MDSNQQVIEKLQKLLRLSQSSNQHEAELAMARAQEIALKHRIDLARIDRSGQPAEQYERESVSRKRTFQQQFVDWIVRGHFNVTIIHAGGAKGSVIYYVGKPLDIEFAKYVSAFLSEEFVRLWNAYQRETRCNQGDRITFFHGVYQGLDAKLKAAKAEAERTGFADQAHRDRYALAVVNDAAAMKAAVVQFFPRLSNSSRSTVNIRSASALAAGRSAGGKININRPIGGRSTAGQLR